MTSRPQYLLPEAIRAARRKQGWTQVELAAHLAVDQSVISRWERGLERPRPAHVIDLLLVFPALLLSLDPDEVRRLQELTRIERELFNGGCACRDCTCATDAA